MPKLPRVTVVQFGAGGPSTDFGQFGSKTAAAPQTTQSPSVIMALAAWATGWTAAAVGAAFNPYLEDMNGFCLTAFYFLANLFERGIPDWIATTTYYKGAVVQDPAGSGQQFYSLTDNNLNQALPLGASNAQWRWLNPPLNVVGASATVGTLPKVSATAPIGGSDDSVALEDSAVSDDGVNVVIDLPLKFPDNSVQSVAAQPVSQQSVVTGSRALGIVYQNTNSRPMWVTVSVYDSGATPGVEVKTDAATPPTTIVAQGDSSNASPDLIPLTFIVLPGNYYKVTGGTLQVWTEWS